ncbi:MAG: hypothetical protein Q4E63_04225 [Prevotellaceae bacterium]|nr:hypothetical protein [Prevotellaceae bacterium]
MKRIALALMALSACTVTMAQTDHAKPADTVKPKILQNGVFNHIDFAVTAGISGFGFEFASPVTDWVRVRTGGVFRPLEHHTAVFGMEVAEGLNTATNSSRFNKLANMMETFTGYKPKSHVKMEGDLGMNNFKFLIDVFPFKNNRHWHFTAGFYYGNGTLIEAKNTAESMNTLTAVATYNTMYRRVLENKSPLDLSSLGVNLDELEIEQIQEYKEKLRKWGSRENDSKGNAIITEEVVTYEYDHAISGERGTGTVTLKRGSFSEYGISIPIGKYAHDVIAQEDVYYDYSEKLYQELNAENINPYHTNLSIDTEADEYHYQKDANGRYIKKGSIRYRKGEVIRKAGEEFRMVPDADNIVKASARASKFKPYIGIGYEMGINNDRRFNVGVDAGIMFWGNHPSVDVHTPIGVNADGETIYMTYDLSRDINGLKGSVEDYVNSIKQFPIFPEISLRLSYRLW